MDKDAKPEEHLVWVEFLASEDEDGYDTKFYSDSSVNRSWLPLAILPNHGNADLVADTLEARFKEAPREPRFFWNPRSDYSATDWRQFATDIIRNRENLALLRESRYAPDRFAAEAVLMVEPESSANGADKPKIFQAGVPDDPAVLELIAALDSEKAKPTKDRKSQSQLAQEIGDRRQIDPKSLERSKRRYLSEQQDNAAQL